MNGSPYYSPPSRHTRCLGDRFIEGDVPKEKPSLEEMPFLVARAMAAGLIKLSSSEDKVATDEPSGNSIADWRKISLPKSPTRAVPIHTCKMCNQPFPGRLSGAGWAKTCSDACANTARIEFHAQKRATRLAAKTNRP